MKSLYQRQNPSTDKTLQENKALNQLISLLDESDTTDLIDRIDLSQILELVETQSQPLITVTNKCTLKKSQIFTLPPVLTLMQQPF